MTVKHAEKGTISTHQKVLAFLMWLVFLNQAQAAPPDVLFLSRDILDITLTAPFGEIDRARDKDTEYEGTLRYTDSNNAEVVLDVKLQVRGNYRLQASVCRYSQLWINIKTGQAEGTLFEHQDNLKLVAQCKDGDQYAEYIAKEEQAYRLFNSVSELSLVSRMLNATYIDSENPKEQRTHLAFFVEHQKRLAKRFDLENVELNSVAVTDLKPDQSSLTSLFMFLVGNTDYSLFTATEGEECCHNAKLLVDQNGSYFPIPYDFDASGFVDTNYAADPAPSLKISSNRQRLFRGYCIHQADVAGSIAKIEAARETMLAIVADTTFVKPATAKRSAEYLNRFFEIVGKESSREDQIVEACRG